VNVLGLCAGIGGLELGIRLAESSARAVCYVEREAYAASVLVARMEDGSLDPAPIWDDLATFDGRPWRGVVDCIAAGFPCQPWSAAGKQLGTQDDRWLWPEIVRVVRDVGPEWVFLENVPGLVSGGGLQLVLGDLSLLGFDAEWMPLSARDVGAPHRRKRIFILAHRNQARLGVERSELSENGIAQSGSDADGGGAGVGYSTIARFGRREDAGTDSSHARADWSRGHEPERDGCELVHAECLRRETPRIGRRLDAGTESETRSGNMADTERSGHYGREIESIRETGIGITTQGASEPMGNGDGTRAESIATECSSRGTTGESSGSMANAKMRRPWNAGTWPPAPNDRERWSAILTKYPEFAPAIERPIRGVVDGIPARMDRLRALGNGVVPLVAATAWRELMQRIGGE
jgi:DNA (cytosine-5)-methyltransferase 1